jgi:hypothetical protein
MMTAGREQARMLYIVSFSPDGSVSAIESANTTRNVEFWLGAGNLMFGWNLDPDTNVLVYYIGEIVNGVWHETEFLRLDRSVFFNIAGGDWYISASVEEKQMLTHLFDSPRSEIQPQVSTTK